MQVTHQKIISKVKRKIQNSDSLQILDNKELKSSDLIDPISGDKVDVVHAAPSNTKEVEGAIRESEKIASETQKVNRARVIDRNIDGIDPNIVIEIHLTLDSMR